MFSPTPLPDEALSIIVGMVNDATVRVESCYEFALTVSGVLISGELIPAWQWHEDLAEQHRSQTDPSALEQLFDAYTARARSQATENSAVADLTDDEPAPNFIHLRGAQIFVSTRAIPTTTGMHWRGRLSEVSGWSIGRVTVQDAFGRVTTQDG